MSQRVSAESPSPIRLLMICDPSVYEPRISEAPEIYHEFSKDPRIDLFHADPTWIHDRVEEMRCVDVSPGVQYADFQMLSRQSPQRIPLDSFDLVFCRTLKPFPEGYMARLCELERHVKFVNSPASITRHLQPTFLSEVASQCIPDTITTRNVEEAVAFLGRFGRIVCKRAGSCSGKGVFQVHQRDDGVWTDDLSRGELQHASPEAALEEILATDDLPFQLVRFLKNIDRGDKRVLVVSGEVVGAYLRRAAGDGWIHNVSSGGSCELAEVTDRERELIAATASVYTEMGVHTLGYDFLIDDDERSIISEINAGNIAGYSLYENVSGVRIYPDVIGRVVAIAEVNESRSRQ